MVPAFDVDNDDKLEKLEKEKFDVAIVDGFLFTKCIYLIPHRLQIPWITYSFVVDPATARIPWLPSFVPNVDPYATKLPWLPNVQLFFSEQMTFVERLKNIAALIVSSVILPLYVPDPEDKVLDKYRP